MATREEMKRLYKETPRPMGVHQMRNLVNGKVFVAASPNLDGAKNSNFFQLKAGSHRNKELQADYREHGAEAFVFEVLETIKERDDLDTLEELWLEKLQPYGERGYNSKSKRQQD